MELYPNNSLQNVFYFKNQDYSNYMVVKEPIPDALLVVIYKSPAWVNLILPIQITTLQNQPAYISLRFDELSFMKRSQFRRFFETITLIIEYLEKNNIFHPNLWSRHSIWTFKNQFFVPPFVPSSDIDARRCLKDAFILACSLIFNISELSFQTLKFFLESDSKKTTLLPLYRTILDFSGDYSQIYHQLNQFKKPQKDITIERELYLATYPPEEMVQKCVLRSLKLIDD